MLPHASAQHKRRAQARLPKIQVSAHFSLPPRAKPQVSEPYVVKISDVDLSRVCRFCAGFATPCSACIPAEPLRSSSSRHKRHADRRKESVVVRAVRWAGREEASLRELQVSTRDSTMRVALCGVNEVNRAGFGVAGGVVTVGSAGRVARSG
jgi:hypothetical protein